MAADMRARFFCIAACLVITASAQSTPLPLPADPETACSPEVTRAWSREYPSCPRAILGNAIVYEVPRREIDDECCIGAQRYFGENSTMPSRNCFCDPDVYARFELGRTAVPISMYMGICYNKGYPVPVYEPVDEVSTGRCSGAEYNSTSYSTTALDPPAEPLVPLKTTREWLRALNQDGFVLASFIVAIISAIGFGGALWIFFFNLIRSFSSNLLTKRYSSKY